MIQQSTQIGGLEGKAIYIDTENKFTPARIKEISDAKKFDVENILKNVMTVHPHNILRQEEDIENIGAICEKDKKIKLVVVDSIINHYRHELGGRNNLSERQHRLIKSITLLERIARFFDIAVVITNQVALHSR